MCFSVSDSSITGRQIPQHKHTRTHAIHDIINHLPLCDDAFSYIIRVYTAASLRICISIASLGLRRKRSCITTCFGDSYKCGIARIPRRTPTPTPTPTGPTRLYILTSDTRDFLKLFLWQAERHADIPATILARMSARMSVSASWNAGFEARTILLTNDRF